MKRSLKHFYVSKFNFGTEMIKLLALGEILYVIGDILINVVLPSKYLGCDLNEFLVALELMFHFVSGFGTFASC